MKAIYEKIPLTAVTSTYQVLRIFDKLDSTWIEDKENNIVKRETDKLNLQELLLKIEASQPDKKDESLLDEDQPNRAFDICSDDSCDEDENFYEAEELALKQKKKTMKMKNECDKREERIFEKESEMEQLTQYYLFLKDGSPEEMEKYFDLAKMEKLLELKDSDETENELSMDDV